LMAVLLIDELTRLAGQALEAAGASPSAAAAAAQALVRADAQGMASHGVSRIGQYTSFLRNGRSNAKAVPVISHSKGAASLVDAKCGMAYEACALAIDTVISRAHELGVACVGVTNSNHFGAAALQLEPVAQAGLVG